ncbi:hypothetical protein ACN2XU_01300 [Primorskyibacter sp. 2E107]|uniref:hypothetical protein n=1 Tax=Primorskyibacter sp. 2E107 TaxID=3403458 RepID=UPI003AF6ACD2
MTLRRNLWNRSGEIVFRSALRLGAKGKAVGKFLPCIAPKARKATPPRGLCPQETAPKPARFRWKYSKNRRLPGPIAALFAGRPEPAPAH